jgi:hypothetical protein
MLGVLLPTRHVLRYVSLLAVVFFCVVGFSTSVYAQDAEARDEGVRPAAAAEVVPDAIAPCVKGGACDDPTFKFLHDFVLGIGGGFAGIFGSVFDLFIDYFIIRFGEQYNLTNLGVVINGVWGTVRDIFNLTFIFGLVYIGFQIILGTNDSEAKRTIPLLVVAALLVNFSLFIVKFVIDFANIAAVQVYGLFKSANAVGAEGGEVSVSISLAFMNALGVSSLLNSLPASGELLYIFGMLAVFLVLAYVFLAGAILVAIRFAVLCMLMVFSPVMFIGWVFPGFAKYSHEYWSKLLNQAFFAPIFLFMLYLSYVVVSTFNDERVGGDIRGEFMDVNAYGNNETVATTFLTVMPFFVMTIVFLLASMHIAKKMGAQGAEWSAKFAKKAVGALPYAAAYPFQAGARYGVNKTGEWGEKKFNNLQTRDGVLGSLARTNFVDRKTRAATKGLTEAKLGTGTYNKAEKEYQKGVKNKSAATKANNELADAIKKGSGSIVPDEIIEMESAVQKASQEDLIKALDKAAKDTDHPEKYQSIVGAMSNSQVTKLLEAKDEEFNDKKKNDLYDARKNMITAKVTGLGTGNLSTGITKATTDDLYALGYGTLLDNAQHIPAAKMDDLKSKLTSTQYSELDKKRKADLRALFATNPMRVFMGKKDSEIARLPHEILRDGQAAAHLRPRVLEIILRENYLEAGHRNDIRTNISTMYPGSDSEQWLNGSPVGLIF